LIGWIPGESCQSLAERIGDAFLIVRTVSGGAQRVDGYRVAEGYHQPAQPRKAPAPRQRLEGAADQGWNGRRAASQQELTDPRQEVLQPAVGRAPTLGKPDDNIARQQDAACGFECSTGMRRIDREKMGRPAEDARQRVREQPQRVRSPIDASQTRPAQCRSNDKGVEIAE
jgi:hypothetical protein